MKDEQFSVLEEWIRLAKEGDREGLYLSFGKEIYPSEVFDQFRETMIEAAKTVTDEELERFIILAEGTRGFDVTDELSKIKCPVLAVGVYEDGV